MICACDDKITFAPFFLLSLLSRPCFVFRNVLVQGLRSGEQFPTRRKIGSFKKEIFLMYLNSLNINCNAL